MSLNKVVSKKSGVTTVHNENGEEMPTHLTTGWRVCIDYLGEPESGLGMLQMAMLVRLGEGWPTPKRSQ